MNIFTIYEPLISNVIKILPTILDNKTCINCAWIIWTWYLTVLIKFYDKMDLPIPLRIFYKSVLARKTCNCSTIKENVILYCRKFALIAEIINFTIASLSFQNRLLNGTHSISDIKFPWIDRQKIFCWLATS